LQVYVPCPYYLSVHFEIKVKSKLKFWNLIWPLSLILRRPTNWWKQSSLRLVVPSLLLEKRCAPAIAVPHIHAHSASWEIWDPLLHSLAWIIL
jgi:hypothetical protein